jgi:alginate O-acetyltransferase complex protein AlgI
MACLYFYATWQIHYASLLIASTLLAFGSGIAIESVQKDFAKRLLITGNLLFNLGLLLAFKYLDFFVEVTNSLILPTGWSPIEYRWHWLLPVGISFYTFQIISYLIDVYREELRAERHLGYFFLFVIFFPKIIAGPIERAGNLLPQFRSESFFQYARVTAGLKLMFWGYFKKLVIADRLAPVVSSVFESPTTYDGFPLLLAAFFFMIQVYCDFSGYSDIAVGSAKVLGINLTQNFKHPYLAQSVSDYWRRWHISMTNWFYDYLYFPELFRRRQWGVIPATLWAILITFALSGLWHGANWTFIVFGLIHAAGLSVELLTKNRMNWSRNVLPASFSATLRWLFMLIFLCSVDVVFRANHLSDAWYILTHMYSGTATDLQEVVASGFSTRSFFSLFVGLGVPKVEILIALGLIFFLAVVEIVQNRQGETSFLQCWPVWARWSVYFAMTILFLTLAAFNQVTQFVYTQF